MTKEISMKHLNGHLLCAVDCETTGLVPGKNDIIQICILPLNNQLEPRQDIMPFYMNMQPKRMENVDFTAMSVNKLRLVDILKSAVDPWKAADLFDEWFERLNLPFNKRIMPLGSNWPFDRAFIMDWLGWETFNTIFDARYRDLQTISLYLNDIASFRAEQEPFAKHNLTYICNALNVEFNVKHDALEDCRVTAEAYRKIIMMAT